MACGTSPNTDNCSTIIDNFFAIDGNGDIIELVGLKYMHMLHDAFVLLYAYIINEIMNKSFSVVNKLASAIFPVLLCLYVFFYKYTVCSYVGIASTEWY